MDTNISYKEYQREYQRKYRKKNPLKNAKYMMEYWQRKYHLLKNEMEEHSNEN